MQLRLPPGHAARVQHAREGSRHDAVVVLRHVEDLGATGAQGADGAGVGGRADEHDVALADEGRGDVVDAVRAARR
jgi:hypothetical protein